MRLPQSKVLGVFFAAWLLGACGGSQRRQVAQPAPTAKATPVDKAPAKPAIPEADIGADMLAFVVGDSLDALLGRGVGYVAKHLPAPMRMMIQPAQIKQQFFQKMRNLPGIEAAIDTARPMALGLVDPKKYHGRGLGPALLALPVKDENALVDALSQAFTEHDSTAWGDHIYGSDGRQIYLRVTEGYAFLASEAPLLHGARAALMPRLKGGVPKCGVMLDLNVERIYRRFKGEIDHGLVKLQRSAKKLPGRGMLKWIRFIKSASHLRATVTLNAADLHGQVVLDPLPGGAMAAYLAKLNAGPLWGMDYLPADSALLMMNRQSPALQSERVEEIFSTVNALLSSLPVDAKIRAIPQRWRDKIIAMLQEVSGEQSTALWTSADGGVGFGGAFAVKDAHRARAAVRDLLETVGADLSKIVKLVARAGKLKGLSFSLAVKKNGFRSGTIRGDLYRLNLRWPRLTKELAGRFNQPLTVAKNKLKKLKAALNHLFGRKLTIALVVMPDATGKEVGLLAAGKDYPKRLAAMVAIAKGGPKTGIRRRAEAFVGKAQITAFVYSPLATLLEQAMRAASKIVSIPAPLAQIARQVSPPPGKDAPVALWVQRHGDGKLAVDVSLSEDVVGMMTKAGMAIFMRIRRGHP